MVYFVRLCFPYIVHGLYLRQLDLAPVDFALSVQLSLDPCSFNFAAFDSGIFYVTNGSSDGSLLIGQGNSERKILYQIFTVILVLNYEVALVGINVLLMYVR